MFQEETRWRWYNRQKKKKIFLWWDNWDLMMQGWIRCKDRLRVGDQIGSYCDNLVWYSKIYNVLCSCMCQALF